MKRRIILAGGSGFLKVWCECLSREVMMIIFTRGPKKRDDGAEEIAWDAKTTGEWVRYIDGAEAVVNLTGKSVDCRYTELNRRLIISSRVDSTRVLGEAIAGCKQPPQVWLNCSSTTLYKHSFDEPMDENGKVGASPEAKDEFSIEVIQQWENALAGAKTPTTRKVALRITLVFGRDGGVYPVFRRLAHFGLGGHMGSGETNLYPGSMKPISAGRWNGS